MSHIILAVILFAGSEGFAASVSPITYQGRILKPDGSALDSITNFRFVIKAPNNCILWEEDQVIDMTNSKGAFSAVVGAGVNAAGGSHSFQDVFQNFQTLTGLDGCPPPSEYHPGLDDDRVLQVSFNDGSGSQTIPPVAIKSVPFSTYAKVAQSALRIMGKVFGGPAPTSTGQILRYNQSLDRWEVSSAPGGVSSVDLSLGGGLFTVTSSPITGAGTLTASLANQAQNSVFAGPSTGGAGVPGFRSLVAADVPDLPASKITTGTLATAVLGVVPGANGGTVTEVQTGVGLVGGPINTNGTIALADTLVTPGSYGSNNHISQFTVDQQGRLTNAGTVAISIDAAQVASGTLDVARIPDLDADKITSGTLATARLGVIPSTSVAGITSSQWSNVALGINYAATGSVGIGVASPIVKLDIDGAIKIANDAAVCAAGFAGAIRYSGGALQYCDGVTPGWVTLGVSGSGLQSLNGLIANDQLFVVGSAGTLAAFTSGGSTHTLNIPMASTTNAVGGLISNAEYLSLMNGTISGSRLADTAVTPGAYGSNNHASQFTVDQQGRLTAAGSVAIAIDGSQIVSGTLATAVLGVVPGANGGTVTEVQTGAGLVGGPINNNGTISLGTSGVAAGSYGSNSWLPNFIVDIYGRLTSAGSTQIAIDASQVTSGTLNSAQLGMVPANHGGTGLDGSGASNGQLLIGNGSGFSLGTLTAGTNITITNSAGGITIASSNSGGTVTEVQTGVGLVGGPINNNGTISLGTSGVAAGSYGSGTHVPTFSVDQYGRLTAAGSTAITSSQWSNVVLGINYAATGSVGIGVASPIVKLDIDGAIKIANDAAVCAAGFAGAIRYSGGALQYCDGVTPGWVTLGVSGSGLQSLNGLIANSQDFAVSSAGTLAAFTSGGSTHTLNIPMASTTNAVGGLISNAEYLSLMNGTISGSRLADTAVTPGSYGSNNHVSQFTVDQQGRLTAAGSVAINIDANQVSSGTLDVARIPDLDASKITTGTLATAVLGVVPGANGGTITEVQTGAGLVGGPINNNGTIALGTSGVAAGSYGSGTHVPTFSVDQYGRLTTAGSTAITSSQWSNVALGINYAATGSIGIGVASPVVKLDIDGAIKIANDTAACAAGFAGAIRYNGGALEYCNGVGPAWLTLGVSGSGLQSLNGLVANNQDFAVSSAGTLAAFTSGGSTHTLNIPMASTTNAVGGLISNAEYLSLMNGTISASRIPDLDASKITTGTLATAVLGVVPGANGGTVTEVQTGAGLVGGPINNNGTISLGTSGVAAGSYGSSSWLPNFIVDIYGRLISAGSTQIAIDASQVTSGTLALARLGTLGVAQGATGLTPVVGDANKVYGVNNSGNAAEFKEVAAGSGITINHSAGTITIATNGVGSVTQVVAGAGLTGGTISSTGTIALPTLLTAGSIGSASFIPQIVFDAFGRITGVGSTAIAVDMSSISGTLGVAQGGTGLNGSSSAHGALLIGNGSGFSLGTLTYSNGMVVTNTAGTINLATNAQTANTNNTIITRDGSGNFAAGAADLAGVTIRGSVTGAASINAPNSFTNYSMILPSDMGTPGQVLRTNGTSQLSWVSAPVDGGTILAASGSAGAPGFAFLADQDTGLYNVGANTLGISTGGTLRVVVDSSGQVGIGTAFISDGNRLEVTGGAIAAGNGGELRMMEILTNGTNSVGFRAPSALANNYSMTLPGSIGSPGQVLSTDGTGSLSWTNAASGINFPLLSTTLGSVATPAYSFSVDSDTGIFSPSANNFAITTGGTLRLSIDNSGNVGIGTATPDLPLDIVRTDGASSASVRNLNSTAPRYPAFYAINYDGSGMGGFPGFSTQQSRGSYGSPAALQANDIVGNFSASGQSSASVVRYHAGYMRFIAGGTWNGTSSPTDIAFGTTPSGGTLSAERLRITAGGSLGIGTTNPSARLDVNGSMRATSLTIAGSGTVSFLAPSSGFTQYEFPSNYGTLGQVLSTNGEGLVSWMSVPANGGIFLAANGSAGTPSFSFSSDNDTGLYRAGANTLAISTAGTARITITNTGFVGIGTTNPNTALAVNGEIQATGNIVTQNHLITERTNTQELRFNGGSGNQWRAISTINGTLNANLVFQNTTNNFSTMTNGIAITPDGNVAIGAQTAGQRLVVHDGNISLNGTSAVGRYIRMSADNQDLYVRFQNNNSTNADIWQMAYDGDNTRTFNIGNSINAGTTFIAPFAIDNGAPATLKISSDGNVGVGTSSPAATALLDMTSTSKGFLPPRMTTAQRNAISSPANGLIVFDVTANSLFLYKNSAWQEMTDGEVISAEVTRTTNQSTTHNTWTDVTWQSATWDTKSLFDAGTPTYLSIPAAGTGKYIVAAQAAFDAAATTGGRWIRIFKNGADVGKICNRHTDANQSGNHLITCTWIMDLAAADTLRMQVYQNSGGAVNIMAGQNKLSVARINGSYSSGGGGADNLGNHTATQNLVIGSNWISRSGDNDGLYIDALGQVGAGTANPQARLHVNGTLQVSGAIRASDGSASAPSITFASEPGNGFFKGVSGGIGVKTTANNHVWTISNSITSPTSGGASIRSADGTATSPVYAFQGDGAVGNGMFRPTNQTLAFTTSSTERLRITSAGSVGIGTTNPIDTLDIRGSGNSWVASAVRNTNSGTLGGAALYLENYGNGMNMIQMNHTRGTLGGSTATQSGNWLGFIQAQGYGTSTFVGGSQIISEAEGNFTNSSGPTNLQFWTTRSGTAAPAERMRLTASGSIGINTPTPDSRLQVSGTFRASSISSNSSNDTDGSLDFSNGNSISTSYNCTGTTTGPSGEIQLSNLRDGGSYTMVVTGNGTAQCGFHTSTLGQDAATVAYRFNPANGARTASSHTVYTMIRVGNIIYVSWITGF